MKYRLLIRRQAKSDLQRAVQWYERQSLGLGKEFIAEIETALQRVRENPLQYQTIYRDIRRTIPHKFPYGIFYRLDQDDVIVLAVIHLHRDPGSWQDRH